MKNLLRDTVLYVLWATIVVVCLVTFVAIVTYH